MQTLFRTMTLVTALSLLTSSVALPAPAAQEGNTVMATPFDRKISTSHVFDVQGGVPSSAKDPLALFMEARSFRYTPDRRSDHWQTPEETEARRAGDCEDKAVWLYAQLKAAGYTDTRLVIGKYKSISRQYHVWVTFTDDQGQTLILDPTTQRRPWKLGDFSGGFYVPYYSYDGRKRYHHRSLGR